MAKWLVTAKTPKGKYVRETVIADNEESANHVYTIKYPNDTVILVEPYVHWLDRKV